LASSIWMGFCFLEGEGEAAEVVRARFGVGVEVDATAVLVEASLGEAARLSVPFEADLVVLPE